MKRAHDRKNGWLGTVAVILIAAIAYVIVSTMPAKAPVTLKPLGLLTFPTSFSIPLDGPTNATQNGGKHDRKSYHAFVGATNYGFFDDSGDFLYMGNREDQMANGGFSLDERFLLQADKKNGGAWLSDMQGAFSVYVPISGIPYISQNRIFVLRNDQMAVAELNTNGSLRWSSEFGNVLTSIAVAKKVSLFGFLDGSVLLNDENGRPLFSLTAKDFDIKSKYRGVYGAALSPQGECFALLYGLEPQYLLVFEKKEKETDNYGLYGLSYTKRLDHEKRTPQPMLFDEEGTTLVVSTADGLVFLDVKQHRSTVLGQARNLVSSQGANAKLIRMDTGEFAALVSSDLSGKADRSEEETRLLVVKDGVCSVNIPMPEASDISWKDGVLFVTLPKGIERFVQGGEK